MRELDPELAEEIRGLMSVGFLPAWIIDLEVGDIFAGPRLFVHDSPREMYVVDRITKVGKPFDFEGDVQPNVVVCMIVTDAEGLERHLAYGHTHEIYIYKGANPYLQAAA